MNFRICAIFFLFLAFIVAPAEAGNRLGGSFVFGMNLAWFDHDYGHDLGKSHPEGWNPSFTEEKCRKYFADLKKMKCRVLRIWAFERHEGLVFDQADTLVIGLDPVFLANCDSVMRLAQEYQLKVCWTLLNHLIAEDEKGKHMAIIRKKEVR